MLAGELQLHGVCAGARGDVSAGAGPRPRPARTQHRKLMDQRGLLGGSCRSRAGSTRCAASPESTSTAATGFGHRPRIHSWAFRRPHRGVAGRSGPRGIGAEVRRGVAVVDPLGQTTTAWASRRIDGDRYRRATLVRVRRWPQHMVRKLLGVGFPGGAGQVETLVGELALTADPARSPPWSRRSAGQLLRFGVIPLENRLFRVVVPGGGRSRFRRLHHPGEFRRRLRELSGTVSGHSPRWLSRFGDATRRADRLPRRPGAAGRRLPRTFIRRRAGRGSTWASGRGQPGLEAGGRTRRFGAPDGLLDSYHRAASGGPQVSTTPGRRWRCCPLRREPCHAPADVGS